MSEPLIYSFPHFFEINHMPLKYNKKDGFRRFQLKS